MPLDGQFIPPQPVAAAPVPDDVIAKRILRTTIQTLNNVRRAMRRCQTLLNNAPGGKAGVLATLSAEQKTELKGIYDKLTALVNAHKPTGASDEAALVQAGD